MATFHGRVIHDRYFVGTGVTGSEDGYLKSINYVVTGILLNNYSEGVVTVSSGGILLQSLEDRVIITGNSGVTVTSPQEIQLLSSGNLTAVAGTVAELTSNGNMSLTSSSGKIICTAPSGVVMNTNFGCDSEGRPRNTALYYTSGTMDVSAGFPYVLDTLIEMYNTTSGDLTLAGNCLSFASGSTSVYDVTLDVPYTNAFAVFIYANTNDGAYQVYDGSSTYVSPDGNLSRSRLHVQAKPSYGSPFYFGAGMLGAGNISTTGERIYIELRKKLI